MALLGQAARRLHTADPAPEAAPVLEESLPLPAGHPAYSADRFFEPFFAETDGQALAFQVSAGAPLASPADGVELATRAMRDLVGRHFGGGALRWFDGRSEPMRGSRPHHRGRGAWFGCGCDRGGLLESLVTYEWGAGLADALPETLFRLVRLVAETAPALSPAYSTIRCGRTSGSQQLTFNVEAALPLAGLKPLMDRLGLGHQHAGLMSATAFVLGARFTLPPDTATVTLRPTRAGMELRLDVNLDALPDPPSQFMSLLRLQMAERPTGLRALDRWLMALTPDGYDGPGSVSVLSVRVRKDMPARVALYLRPGALDRPEGDDPAGGTPAEAPPKAAALR
jgi:hypothetical protein